MKVLAHIITFLFILSGTGFLILISFNFTGVVQYTSASENTSQVTYFKARIKDVGSSRQTIEKEEIDTNQGESNTVLTGSEIGYVEFGKLATAFFMGDQSGSLSFKNILLSGSVLSIDPQYPSIISLYDPFTMYSIDSLYRDFTIVQITNGSIYIGREKDGTYSLYSIDAVVRLDFLDQGNTMTDMILFPGMYIRFDPRMNSSLSGANLFRILQSLEPNGTEEISVDSTGIEFVNPRMNTKNEKDSFLMYRLPMQTRLFQMLHILFYERVSQVDMYEEYGASILLNSDTDSSNSLLINPGKKSHILLLQLDEVLANALNNSISIGTFRSKVAEVNEGAQALKIGNSVENRLEKFLTDGRFALFRGVKNVQFADIYQAASEVIGKAPRTAHAKLLQGLSDIYSKNLVTQKKDLSFASIDTYTPTARELERTLESDDIQQRDYFDIALYAFNVLKKMQDKGLFTEEAINSHPTYTLIRVVLASTDRYVRSIKDIDKKTVTYEGILLHFYFHLISTLTHSVYANFTDIEDGKIFLKMAYAPNKNEEKIRIDEALIQDMLSIDEVLSDISDRMDEQYNVSSTNNIYISIKKYIALYHAFSDLLNYDSYVKYQGTPYLVDESNGLSIPLFQSGVILRFDPTKTVVQEEVVTTDDPDIEKIRGVLGGLPIASFKKEIDGYSIDSVDLGVVTGESALSTVSMSIFLNADTMTFSNPILTYEDKTIYVLTDKKKIEELEGVLLSIPEYINRLNTIFAGNNELQGGIRFLDTTKKIAIGRFIFPLVP